MEKITIFTSGGMMADQDGTQSSSKIRFCVEMAMAENFLLLFPSVVWSLSSDGNYITIYFEKFLSYF
jgi:hypothetical protein